MTTQITYGFLDEGPFLDTLDFLTGRAEVYTGWQVDFVVGVQEPLAAQTEFVIDKEDFVAFQANFNQLKWYGWQTEFLISTIDSTGAQFEGVINTEDANASQALFTIEKETPSAFQSEFIIFENNFLGSQFEGVIDTEDANASQALFTIEKESATAFQSEFIIIKNNFVGSQFEGFIDTESAFGFQANFKIEDVELANGMQSEFVIEDSSVVGFQFKGKIEDYTQATGWQFTPTRLSFKNCPGFLDVHPFLDSYAWLSGLCGHQGWQTLFFNTKSHSTGAQFTGVIEKQTPTAIQFEGFISTIEPIGAQFEGIINIRNATGFQFTGVIEKEVNKGWQFEGVIEKEIATGYQVEFVSNSPVGWQVRFAIYNTDLLRILYDFPSRGAKQGSGLNAWGNPIAEGENWISTSTATGDFSPFNLNTDIVEQYWRSANTVKIVTLSCDTEINQGIFLDTFAMLNHNITSSATIQLQGSTVSNFASIGFTQNLTWTKENIYYIADDLPLLSFRYWRVIISDTTNPEDFLRIGTIVFGSCVLFQGECFIDRVTTGRKHFKDQVMTEAFSNVSNDRGIKRFTRLTFKNLDFTKRNYKILQDVFETARTNLKCLWIPTPKYPTRFAVFGKLQDLPEESHNDKGIDLNYVDLEIVVDESL